MSDEYQTNQTYQIVQCCASCKFGGIKSGYEGDYFLWCHQFSGNTAHAGCCDKYEARPVECENPQTIEYRLNSDDGTTKVYRPVE
jgi:hypothetical protein